jgi:hypothetical protein
MAELKVIFMNSEGKPVSIVSSTKIDNFDKFADLKQSIRSGYAKKVAVLKQNIILQYIEEKKGKLYFPEILDNCIWDNYSFEYFKEKLSVRGIKNVKYTFELKIIQKPRGPFIRPKYDGLLSESLGKIWAPILNEITSKVGLKELEKLQVEYAKRKESLEENEKKINGKHKNIVCNHCLKNNITGKRFVCAECNNFNLCQDCEKLFYRQQIHDRKHTLIQVNKPLSSQENIILKYNNIIPKNNIELKVDGESDYDELFIEFDLINNGFTNLKNCYFLPVRYGDDYLKCLPKVISENIDMNYTEKIKLYLKLPNSGKKYYEGYFRMFTPCGLPFGQVIFIKLFLDD